MTIRNAIDESAQSIARRDAETLLAHILGRERAWLFAHSEDRLSPEHLAQLRALTARRAAHEPLQHLTGEQEFFGLNLRVTKDTLIPRPETERLVEAVIEWDPTGVNVRRILDIGTGTGAIAIALAKYFSEANLVASDLSAAALKVAHENAMRHSVANRIQFVESDLLASVEGRFDIIISNPPYVSLADASTLAPEVRNYEPRLALFGRPEQNSDGLGIYRLLIPQAHTALVPGGLLALEIGFGQAEPVRALVNTSLWHNLRILDDYAGVPRVVLAERHQKFQLTSS